MATENEHDKRCKMAFTTLDFSGDERVVLHAHSNHSIGACSPERLAALADQNHIDVLALTDHSTVDGIAELTEHAAKHGIYIIPAVEIHGMEADFIGYFVDHQNKELQAFLNNVKRMQEERVDRTLEKLLGFGFFIDQGMLYQLAYPGPPTRTTIAKLLVEDGLFPDVHAVFSYLLGEGAPAYQPAIAPDAEACISAIQKAGGCVVEAHPHLTHLNESPAIVDKFYEKMIHLGLKGYESPPMNRPQFLKIADRIQHIGEYFGLQPIESTGLEIRDVSSMEVTCQTMGADTLLDLMSTIPAHQSNKWYFEQVQDPAFLEKLCLPLEDGFSKKVRIASPDKSIVPV